MKSKYLVDTSTSLIMKSGRYKL